MLALLAWIAGWNSPMDLALVRSSAVEYFAGLVTDLHE
jgi:hypothetical protein